MSSAATNQYSSICENGTNYHESVRIIFAFLTTLIIKIVLIFRFLSLLVLLLGATLIKSDGDRENELYTIRGVPSNLVLDAGASHRVTMQYFSGSKSQLWKFVRGRRAGLYQIVNNSTG